jgi:hypothetical protein
MTELRINGEAFLSTGSGVTGPKSSTDGFRRSGIEAQDRTRSVWIGRGVLGLKGKGEGARSISGSSLSRSSSFLWDIGCSMMEPMLKLDSRLRGGEDMVDVKVEVEVEVEVEVAQYEVVLYFCLLWKTI